jgi:hypothetical protein
MNVARQAGLRWQAHVAEPGMSTVRIASRDATSEEVIPIAFRHHPLACTS